MNSPKPDPSRRQSVDNRTTAPGSRHGLPGTARRLPFRSLGQVDAGQHRVHRGPQVEQRGGLGPARDTWSRPASAPARPSGGSAGRVEASQARSSRSGDPPSAGRAPAGSAAAMQAAACSAGVIAEGIEANQLMGDNPEAYNGGVIGGPSALSRHQHPAYEGAGVQPWNISTPDGRRAACFPYLTRPEHLSSIRLERSGGRPVPLLSSDDVESRCCCRDQLGPGDGALRG